MFTHVNLRCVNKFGHSLNEQQWRTITFVCHKVLPTVDHVNALKGKSFL